MRKMMVWVHVVTDVWPSGQQCDLDDSIWSQCDSELDIWCFSWLCGFGWCSMISKTWNYPFPLSSIIFHLCKNCYMVVNLEIDCIICKLMLQEFNPLNTRSSKDQNSGEILIRHLKPFNIIIKWVKFETSSLYTQQWARTWILSSHAYCMDDS